MDHDAKLTALVKGLHAALEATAAHLRTVYGLTGAQAALFTYYVVTPNPHAVPEARDGLLARLRDGRVTTLEGIKAYLREVACASGPT